jgi:hypothetical protein
MADRKDRMALLSRFNKYYKLKYESEPIYNQWVEQWAADALIESYGIKKCYEILDYYFSVTDRPDWKYFSNFAHEIIMSKQNKEQDDKEREERRRLARKWLSE